MAGHSRSKNGVALLAYVPAIHVLATSKKKNVDDRDKPGHDGNMEFYPFAGKIVPSTSPKPTR